MRCGRQASVGGWEERFARCHPLTLGSLGPGFLAGLDELGTGLVLLLVFGLQISAKGAREAVAISAGCARARVTVDDERAARAERNSDEQVAAKESP